MSTSFTRREALRIGAAAASAMALATGAVNTARAIEPIARGGRPKFKFSLAAYSYRDLFKPNNRFAKVALTLHDFAKDCAKMQLEGTELTSYYFPSPVTNGYLADLRRHCFRLGLDVSGTAVGNDFAIPRDRDVTGRSPASSGGSTTRQSWARRSSASSRAASNRSRLRRRLIG